MNKIISSVFFVGLLASFSSSYCMWDTFKQYVGLGEPHRRDIQRVYEGYKVIQNISDSPLTFVLNPNGPAAVRATIAPRNTQLITFKGYDRPPQLESIQVVEPITFSIISKKLNEHDSIGIHYDEEDNRSGLIRHFYRVEYQ